MDKQKKLSALIDKASQTHSLTKEEIQALLDTKNLLVAQKLYDTADQQRCSQRGKGVHMIASARFSNHCRSNCSYCPFRRDNAELKRFRMSEKEILMMGLYARELGFTHIILRSGDDPEISTAQLISIVRRLKAHKVEVILDCGERNIEDFKGLEEVKLRGYMLPIITSNSSYYRSVHLKDPRKQWNYRDKLQYTIVDSGIDLYTGSVIGMPAQTSGNLADDILYFQELAPYAIHWQGYVDRPGAFFPPGQEIDPEVILKLIAISRLLMPKVHLIAAPELKEIETHLVESALMSGADVVLSDLTDLFFDKENVEQRITRTVQEQIDVIQDCGYFEYH